MSAVSTVPLAPPQRTVAGQSIGGVAAELGVSVHTLRYYERAGLLDVPRRGGVRCYGPAETARLRFLLALRATGMPIALIRRYVELARQGEHTQNERRALLITHRGDVQARLAALGTDLGAIERKINLYDQQQDEQQKERR